MPTVTRKLPVTLTVDETERAIGLLADLASQSFNHARTTKSAAIRAHCTDKGTKARDLGNALTQRLYVTIPVCPDCGDILTDRGNDPGVLTYCDTCDRDTGRQNQFSTLYEMEPIGVNKALEAVAALHFCDDACRNQYTRAQGQQYAEGREALRVDGEVCEFCNNPLEKQE